MNYSLNQPRNDYFQPQIFSNSPHNKTDTIALHFIIIITIIIIQELFDMTKIHSIQTRDIHLHFFVFTRHNLYRHHRINQ